MSAPEPVLVTALVLVKVTSVLVEENVSKVPSSKSALKMKLVSISSVLKVRLPALAVLERVKDCVAVVPHGMSMTKESFERDPLGALPTVIFIVVVSLL